MNKIKATLVALVALATIFVAPVAANAGTDTTDPPPGGCSNGDMCLYENKDYGGIKLEWVHPTNTHGCYTLGGGPLDNKVSSIVNLTGHNAWFSQTASCGGTGAWIFPTTATRQYRDLAGSGWNDVFSGFTIVVT